MSQRYDLPLIPQALVPFFRQICPGFYRAAAHNGEKKFFPPEAAKNVTLLPVTRLFSIRYSPPRSKRSPLVAGRYCADSVSAVSPATQVRMAFVYMAVYYLT